MILCSIPRQRTDIDEGYFSKKNTKRANYVGVINLKLLPLGPYAKGLHRKLLPREALSLGDPQTIIRHPLPSPDRHKNSVHTGCSCGSVPPPHGVHFSSYRLQVCKFHTGILECVVGNIFINFSHRSPRTLRVFSFFETFFNTLKASAVVLLRNKPRIKPSSCGLGFYARFISR